MEQMEKNDEFKILDDELEWTANFVNSFSKEDEHAPLDKFSDDLKLLKLQSFVEIKLFEKWQFLKEEKLYFETTNWELKEDCLLKLLLVEPNSNICCLKM